jgi:hypothetical protein
MKYLKRFENIDCKFKIGDYVIVYIKKKHIFPEIYEFLNNNVGVVQKCGDEYTNETRSYQIKYDNMPNDLKNYTIFTVIDDGKIVFAKETEMRLATKEEIKNQEMKNKTYKYNL